MRTPGHEKKGSRAPAPHTMMTYMNFFLALGKMTNFFKNYQNDLEKYDLSKYVFGQI